ncbi:patatin-like phospholipase family protein [Nocardioides sambongensis]|uniref:patatin-like phospholipase family protein n=1 Tax=Nocardioides sambongensis TaxID=2589074 RepID=UPI00112C90B2|nr:patatin-like phospholipase family protein [Nocardioides sambongensis]
MTIGFVLGGGGVRGAVHVGMLKALFESGVRPDLVVGTSIGAITGAAVAADPDPRVVERLTAAWSSPAAGRVYGEPWYHQLRRFARSRINLYDPAPLRDLITEAADGRETFEELAVPLVVSAACIETSSEEWFDSGPLVQAVLASSSVPGALPPTPVGDRHYLDGGLVNSIPLGEAIRRGATTVYVLQVGRIEEPLTAPHNAADVARVAFEIARRHRFFRELENAPDDVTVHVLPTGGSLPGDDRLNAFKRLDTTQHRIEQAYTHTRDYLARVGGPDRGAGT